MAIDPNIKKKANDIRNKIYGKEVRESLASGLEAMSSNVVENEGRQSVVEGRQDSVESQWQAVSDEMTDKDIISAPEIIAARDGEANLKDRLDADRQNVTAQFAQNDQEKRATSKPKVIVTIETDDALIEDYEVLLPFLNERGVPATTAIPPADIGRPEYMSWEQVHELVDTHGWSVASHTISQVRLGQSTRSEIDYQCRESKRMLEEQGFKCEHISYPNGDYNDEVMEVAKKYYKSATTTTNGINATPVRSLALRRTPLGGNTLDNIKLQINAAVNNGGGWVIIFTHGNTFATDELARQRLSDAISYAKSVGAVFMNHDDAWDEVGNVIDIGLYGSENMENNLVISKRGEVALFNKVYDDKSVLSKVGKRNPWPLETLVSYEKGAITYNEITAERASSYPEGRAGLLITNYLIDWTGYPYQEYHVQAQNRVYRRVWIQDEWSEFKLVQGSIEGVTTIGPYSAFTVPLSRELPHTDYQVLGTMSWNSGAMWVPKETKTTSSFQVHWENRPETEGEFGWKIVGV